jgi:predicted RND superfamily exporter protein
MWDLIARFVLRFRLFLLAILIGSTVFMGWHASKVQLSYEFSRAIPTDDPRYLAYKAFLGKFGDDGNILVIGVQTNRFFEKEIFNDYLNFNKEVKQISGVEAVRSVPYAITLEKKDNQVKLNAVPVFPAGELSQDELDSGKKLFFGLPFYRGLLYNPSTHAYLMGVSIRNDIMGSPKRIGIVDSILAAGNAFGKRQGFEMHYSGLPLIRTHIATSIATEMKWFLLGYVFLSAFILMLFFRSIGTLLLSLGVVGIGVIWSFGTMHLFDYKITLLNALIPPLVIVIGIPNCIYFLNKYHSAFKEGGDKRTALLDMIRKMGIVTLFCNISAAIGFAVFALTKSAVLKEFGVVAGINIMMLFFISVILIPTILSYLPDPTDRQIRYLTNRWLTAILERLEIWSLYHRALIYGITVIVLLISVTGAVRLRAEGFIVDDLPKTDPIYKDLKFFEQNFKGVMPLEIIVDTKIKNGLRITPLQTFSKIDSLSAYMASRPEMARPLSLVEGLKFARQGFYNGDSSSYGLPNQFDISFLMESLNSKTGRKNRQDNFEKLLLTFVDSNKQMARINTNMADVGSRRLEQILKDIEIRSASLFDSTKYSIQLTGSSVTFLAGSEFIIKGLKVSILWAFLLIAACMLYLFRSFKILLCSLIPNIIPLIITAGVMGWVGVALKPSTVLVFSIAFGIAIDITIRFLVNYKQDLKSGRTVGARQTIIDTIHTTGISIIYTSLVLIAGFIIFCFSNFGGTQALGWLTSLTLVMATLTNLIFLPALLMSLNKN